LEIAKSLAVRAGKKILKVYASGKFETSQKGNMGPLTKADLSANSIIVGNLKKKFPNHAILTEEGADDKKRLKNDYVWIIDPLDGTKEFIAGNTEFTVNIALVHGKKPIMGVVYAPARDELYFALKGFGAYLEKNGKIQRINVSDKSKLNKMVLVKSRYHPSEAIKRLVSKGLFASAKTYGSSLKGCMIAAGKADVYFRFGPISEWDICAMNIIIDEAGGILTNLSNQKIQYNSEEPKIHGFIVSNNRAHDKLIKLSEGVI